MEKDRAAAGRYQDETSVVDTIAVVSGLSFPSVSLSDANFTLLLLSYLSPVFFPA